MPISTAFKDTMRNKMLSDSSWNGLVGRLARIAYALSPVIFCVVYALFAGKDLNYDALNYHAYLPFSLLEGRVGQDFYAAGPQSYLNPVGYLFFYFLISVFDSSMWVAVFLAASHSLIIYVLYFLSKKLFAESIDDQSIRVELLSALSVVIGCCTLMLMQEIGSSFIDIYTASLNLLALYFIISIRNEKDLKLAGAAGAALGISVALKSISVVYAFPLFISLLVRVGVSSRTIRLILIFCGVSLVFYAAVAGFWLLKVYQYTGNPIFPLFNDFFCSDYYFCQSISQVRFQKQSFVEYLYWPFIVALPVTWYYSELIAPDVRFLVLAIAICCLFFKKGRGFFKSKTSIGQVALFYILSFVFWIVLLGNGRYAIDLFVLVGPLLVLALFSLLNRRMFGWAVVLVIGFQVLVTFAVGVYRWAPIGFGDEWFDFSVPEELKAEPYLYVSIDGQSASFLALKVHPDSAFINISGQLTLPFNDALQYRFESMLSKNDAGIKIITRAYVGEMREWIESWVERINRSVERVGLKVADSGSCRLISAKTMSDVRGEKIERERYVVCSAVYDKQLSEDFQMDVVLYDRVFDELSEICKDWFNPKYAVTERDGKDWMRRYAGTDLRVSVDKHGVIWVRFSNRILPWSVGNIKTWDMDKKVKDICLYRFPKIYQEAFGF